MSSIIYAFKKLQCLHLDFKDFNLFSHLCFQKTTMSSFRFQKTLMSTVIYAFQRLQCLHLHFKNFNDFRHLGFEKTIMSSFTFQSLQCLQSFTLSKDYNVFIYILKDFNVFSFLYF